MNAISQGGHTLLRLIELPIDPFVFFIKPNAPIPGFPPTRGGRLSHLQCWMQPQIILRGD